MAMTEAELRRCLDLLQRSDGRYLLRLAERDHVWEDAAGAWVPAWDLWLVDVVRGGEVLYRDYAALRRDWPELCRARSLQGYVLLGPEDGALSWPAVRRALDLPDTQSRWRLSAIAQAGDGPLSLLPRLPYLLEVEDAHGGRTVRTDDELCALLHDGEGMAPNLRPRGAAGAVTARAPDGERVASAEDA
jgi:hypothetical protein